LEELG